MNNNKENLINMFAYINSDGLRFRVLIKDVKDGEYLVAPEAGNGEAWVKDIDLAKDDIGLQILNSFRRI